MVGVRGTAHVPALERKLAAEARHKFGAQAAKAPLLNQKRKTALGARFARAMIAVNLNQFRENGGCLEQFDKDIQRRSDGESSGAHLAAHQNVEAKPASLLRGNERDVLRLTVRAIVRATRDGDIEFSRQIGELGIPLAADDDANVVDAGLERAQVHAPQLFEDFRYGVKSETAQLHLLPGGDVHNAVAEPP